MEGGAHHDRLRDEQLDGHDEGVVHDRTERKSVSFLLSDVRVVSGLLPKSGGAVLEDRGGRGLGEEEDVGDEEETRNDDNEVVVPSPAGSSKITSNDRSEGSCECEGGRSALKIGKLGKVHSRPRKRV